MHFRVHKTRGTSKIVIVEADTLEFLGGALVFRVAGRVVMAYAPWAWKTVSEEIDTITNGET